MLDSKFIVATDLRKLVLDGYPAHNVLGCDLRESFIHLGFELYSDKDTCKISFFTDNVLELPLEKDIAISTVPNNKVQSLIELKGRVSHIYAGALFHLFDEEIQRAIAVRLALLLKEGSGGIIFGRHQGNKHSGIFDDGTERHVDQSAFSCKLDSYLCMYVYS